MSTVFYDKKGKPTCYTQDDIHLFSFPGKPLAYIHEKSIYSFGGKHLGWISNGWIRDSRGCCLLFTPEATGGAPKPGKQGKPGKGGKQGKPGKGGRQGKPGRPGFSTSWSDLTADEFFSNQ